MSPDVDVPRPSDGHLLIDDLVALVDGDLSETESDAAQAHLVECESCRTLLQRVGAPIDGTGSDDPIDPYTFVPLTSLPVTGEPAIGELWQLDWEADALIALVVGVTQDGHIVVAPVTIEPPADESGAARLGLVAPDTTVWVWPAPHDVPLGVFSYPVGAARLDQVDAVLTQVREASNRPFLEEIAVGGRDLVRRTELSAALSALAAVQWLPQMAEQPLNVRDLLTKRRLRPSEAAELAGLPASTITELARGVRRANDMEASALAKALGVSAAGFRTRVSLPEALVRAVERPVHRAAIRARAIAAGVHETAARLSVAEAVYARPARTAGDTERDVNAWSALVAHELDA